MLVDPLASTSGRVVPGLAGPKPLLCGFQAYPHPSPACRAAHFLKGRPQKFCIDQYAGWKRARWRGKRQAAVANQLSGTSGQSLVKDSVPRRVWRLLVEWFPPLGSPEAIRRAVCTILIIAFVRLGAFIPLYGVNLSKLPASIVQMSEAQTLTGSLTTVPANIFLLGIGPLVGASMVLSFVATVPSLFNFRPKPGKEGEAQVQLTTRVLTLILATFVGTFQAFQLHQFAYDSRGFIRNTMLTLAGGAMVLTHMADEVEQRGLGNGITLLIAISILLRQAETLVGVFEAVASGLVPLWQACLATAAIFGLVFAAIFISLTEKRYNMISYKIDALPEQRRRRRARENRSFLPMRISPSGVSNLLTVGLYLHLILTAANFLSPQAGQWLFAVIYRPDVLPLVTALLAFLIIAVDFAGGKRVSDLGLWMQKVSAGVEHSPPLVPGAPTVRFLARQQALCHFWGGLAVALLACLAYGLDAACVHSMGVSFGAVSMLLLTGFITTGYRQVATLSELPRLSRRIENEQRLMQSYTE